MCCTYPPVGMGFIPVLPTADKIQSKCPAAARVGINPNPTECYNHFDNPLITIVLHTSAVGTGFIPVLLTADKIQSKYPAAARMGINPTPTCMYAANVLFLNLVFTWLHEFPFICIFNPLNFNFFDD